MDEAVSDVTRALDGAWRQMAAASAGLLRLVAEVDEAGLWARDGATCTSGWLAARYGLSSSTAREWVRVARALRGLPHIRRAYERGSLSWDQIRPLTRFVTGETDRWWAGKAPELRPSTLHREARRHERANLMDERDHHRRRSLWLWWDPELPMLHLEGMVGAEQGEALEQALRKRSQEVPTDPEATSPFEARMADALVDLVTSAGGKEPRPQMVVHVSSEVLTGEDHSGPWLGETEGGRRLSGEALRRLGCWADVEWVVEDGGRPVGSGRSRKATGRIMRALRHRDEGTCRFPGCSRKRWLHAHHLVHWAHGGRTDLDNLILLCSFHHRLCHEGGWAISGTPGRDLRFHDPGGVPIRSGGGQIAGAPP